MSKLNFIPESVDRVDPNFEASTHLLHHFPKSKEKGRIKLWAGVTDTGAGNAMSPALRILSAEHDLFVLAREAGEVALSTSKIDFKIVKDFHPSLRLEGMRGDIVFTGMASNPTLELLIHKASKGKMIRVAIEDFPGAYGTEYKGFFDNDPTLVPDYLLVMNAWAKEANLRELPMLREEQVKTPGQPTFDVIATEDREELKANIYSDLGLSLDEELVVFMGQKGGTKEALEILVKGLTKSQILTDKKRLVIRRHPRGLLSKEEALDMTNGQNVIDTDHIPTSQIGAVAAAVVTIASTEGMCSVMRRIPTIHIMTKYIMDLTESPNVVVPVVKDKSSLLVTEKDQITTVLETAFDKNYQSWIKNRDNPWEQDGKSSERVANTLVEIAKVQKITI